MTHLEMLYSLAEANRQRDWPEVRRLRALTTTPTPCATPAEAAYCASTPREHTMKRTAQPKRITAREQLVAATLDAYRQQAAQEGIQEVTMNEWAAIAQAKAAAQFGAPNTALEALWIEE